MLLMQFVNAFVVQVEEGNFCFLSLYFKQNSGSTGLQNIANIVSVGLLNLGSLRSATVTLLSTSALIVLLTCILVVRTFKKSLGEFGLLDLDRV
jgi:hypothetical protein